MKKNLPETIKISKSNIEIILPEPEPETRRQFIPMRAEQFKKGELTSMHIGKELKLSMQY